MAPQAPRVLVVEDDADGREPLCELLAGEGYDVTGASSGTEALALVEQKSFDAVLVDLGLPDVDGLEVLRLARVAPDRPVVVVFSGYHALRNAAKLAGADEFILKPDVDGLLSVLASLISERRFVVELGKKMGE
jgi:CheY-like chemotaxis protein